MAFLEWWRVPKLSIYWCLGFMLLYSINEAVGVAPAYTAEVVVPYAEQIDIRAKSGLEYRLFVAVPPGSPPIPGWPVTYLTDGNNHFLAMLATAQKQSREGLSQVIVGIGYPTDDRAAHVERHSWDLTPETSPEWQARAARGMSVGKTGGNDEFLQFIEEEVKPVIRQKCRVDDQRQTLFGHSFGGLFALHVLFNRPECFQTYLITSPSIWWNDRSIQIEEQQFYSSPTSQAVQARVLIMVGQLEQAAADLPPERQKILAERKMVDSAKDLVGRITEADISGLSATFIEFPEEDHGSVVLPAVHHGLRFASRTQQVPHADSSH